MEIIRHDTEMHRTVQEWSPARSIADGAAELSYDDMARVWEHVERHMEMERQMTAMVDEMLSTVAGKRTVMQEYSSTSCSRRSQARPSTGTPEKIKLGPVP